MLTPLEIELVGEADATARMSMGVPTLSAIWKVCRPSVEYMCCEPTLLSPPCAATVSE
jgi:hypothetical protein